MSIVQPSQFEGKYTLANTSEAYIDALIQASIDDYEPKLLTLLLGAELYVDMLADPTDTKYIALRNNCIPSILPYVYCKYQEDNVTSTTGNGEVNNNNANSTQSTPLYKIVKRWNEMVANNETVVKFIQANAADYGVYYQKSWPYLCHSAEARAIFITENVFGL